MNNNILMIEIRIQTEIKKKDHLVQKSNPKIIQFLMKID